MAVVFDQQQGRPPAAAAFAGKAFQQMASADLADRQAQVDGPAFAILTKHFAQARGQFGPDGQRLETGQGFGRVAPFFENGDFSWRFGCIRVREEFCLFHPPEPGFQQRCLVNRWGQYLRGSVALGFISAGFGQGRHPFQADGIGNGQGGRVGPPTLRCG